MATNSKSVIDAAKSVGDALEGLSTDDQQKVIDSVAVLMGLKRPVLTEPAEGSGDAGSGAATGAASAAVRKSVGKQQSLVEYMNNKRPATNSQRIAVFAAYREEVEGLEYFSKDDLEPYFAKAKLAAPGKNYNRDYNNAVSEGWIHDDAAASYLTQTGQTAITAGFGGKAKPRGKAAAKAAGKKAKTND